MPWFKTAAPLRRPFPQSRQDQVEGLAVSGLKSLCGFLTCVYCLWDVLRGGGGGEREGWVGGYIWSLGGGSLF